MRLLRTDTDDLVLETFHVQNVFYGILSHRWLEDEEEVTYNDIMSKKKELCSKAGWKKLDWCRKQAAKDGYRYIWADTACIDKSSSQELTESINSMYKWYANAAICYVYLHDMPDPVPGALNHDTTLWQGNTEGDASRLPADGFASIRKRLPREKTRAELSAQSAREAPRIPLAQWDRGAFKKCEWFTRAWTLQEMLAPSQVRFYSQTWTLIAALIEIVDDVSEISGVDRDALAKRRPPVLYSIAQRMSWAAHRTCTKVEDRAYSLLGLMDVAMPVVYGEGAQAFQRLQEELLRTSSDDSIFAFEDSGRTIRVRSEVTTTLLAHSPSQFSGCGDVICLDEDRGSAHQIFAKEVQFRARLIDPRRPTPYNQVATSISALILRLHSFWMRAIFFQERSRPPEKRHKLALLRSRRTHNPAVTLSLRLSCRSGDPNSYFVQAHPRIEALNLYQEQSRDCPFESFTVARLPAEVGDHLAPYCFHVVCGGETRCLSWELVDASHPTALTTWNPETTSFTIPADNTIENRFPLHFSAELDLCYRGQSIARVFMTLHNSNLRFFRLKFTGNALHLPDWTTSCLFKNSYYSSVKFHKHGFLVVKGFARRTPLGRQDVLVLSCERLGYVQLVPFVITRLVIAILSNYFHLCCHALAVWALTMRPPLISYFVFCEACFISVHLGIVSDRRSSEMPPLPWTTSNWWTAFLDWYLDRRKAHG